MNRLFKKKSSSEPTPVTKPRRILVIGSSKHTGVKCADWNASHLPNVADYDVVMVNTESLNTELKRIPETENEHAWKRLRENIDTIRLGLLKLLDSNGEVYAIATPEVRENFGSGRVMERQLATYFWCLCR